MATFLTVREASKKTGRSMSYIRRIMYSIRDQEGHPDRGEIDPSVERAQELRIQGENFAWRISEELLMREIAARAKPEKEEEVLMPRRGEQEPASRELVVLLREQLKQSQDQLKVIDQQIASLSELTNSLNDRLREGNILIGSLQKQLAPPGDGVKEAAVVPPQKPATKPAQQGTKPSAKREDSKSSRPVPKKPARKGFLARLFS